jgi:membrane associated rhomboid family serine protease
MLDDRHYMRGEPTRSGLSATVVLMIVVTIAFALQQIEAVYLRTGVIPYLLLSVPGLARGFVWQLLTFQFLHAGLLHLVCNLIGMWFFGRYVEARLGRANFWKLYFLSGVFGGLLHSLVAWVFPNHFGFPVLGASAGVLGLLAAFAMLEPESEILLAFILPIRAKYFLIVATAIALFFTIVPSDPGIAHTAHLGGILVGVAYIRWQLYARQVSLSWKSRPPRLRPRELVKVHAPKGGPWQRSKSDKPDDLSSADFISKEVDPILDKISAHGIQSLTERERKILEAARAKMERR